MNNNGLYIKEFEARGENVSTSKLTFQKGCNVVLGKSDTGKTTLYSIIEFVLGKGSIDLTLPPEGDGYTDFLLEIHTYDERVYTLRRSINSMSVYVSPCLLSEYDGQHKELNIVVKVLQILVCLIFCCQFLMSQPYILNLRRERIRRKYHIQLFVTYV